MAREIVVSFLTFVAVVMPGLAVGPTTEPAPLPNAKVLLERPLPEVNLKGVSLADALTSFAQLSHVSVVPNWGDLEAAGVKRDVQVTISAKDLKAADVLQRILRAAGTNAGYVVEHNVAYVATQKERSRRAFAIGNAVGDRKANETTARLLARGVPHVKLDAVQMNDALNFCRDTIGVPLDVDWESLKRAGLEPDQKITIELEHIAAGDVIYWILRPLATKATIVWSLNDGTFHITTAEAPARKP